MAKYGSKRRSAIIARFLSALEQGLSVNEAVRLGKIRRNTAYQWRQDDPDFAAAWDAAREAGWDALEDEARRRATDGIRTPVLHQGKPVLVPSEGYDAAGEPLGALVPLYEHKYSDALLMFLLGNRRDFKARHQPEVLAPRPPLDTVEVARRISYLLDEGRRKLALQRKE